MVHVNIYSIPDNMTIVNDGNTIKGIAKWDDKRWQTYITGGPFFEKKYYPDHFTLHWGASDDSGTEHIVDGKGFALEIQVVFYNDKYDSYEEAVQNKEGVLIVSGLYSVDGDLYEATEQEGLEELWKVFDEPMKEGDERIIKPFSLGDFGIGPEARDSAVYDGSLTTPPCTETIKWVVLFDHFSITREKMAKLRKNVQLRDGDDHNNRPIQPLNDRKEWLMRAF